MSFRTHASRALAGVMILLGGTGSTLAQEVPMVHEAVSFSTVISRVVAMPSDADLRARVQRHGLNVLNVTWEDTARSSNSAWGPNISDLTLQVLEGEGARRRSHLLPVIRFPNFTDRTGDIPIDAFHVRTGNQREGGEVTTVPLRDVLSNLQNYLTMEPPLLRDGRINLLAERDTHLLVSAQHVFLPIPQEGEATFTPVLFNYQSRVGNPAVLVIMATREGISTTVIENRPGEQTRQGWGQQLFFNKAGQRAPFTAERLSTVARRIEEGRARDADAGALDPGADVLLFIQVPLVHRAASRGDGMMLGATGSGAPMPSSPSVRSSRSAPERSDVEVAVLGHGEAEGPFIELNGNRLERDTRFPVRVTVQFYRATSNGVVSDDDLRDVAAQIERVYSEADYVGSLVVPAGPRDRPTDWIRTNPEADVPPGPPWWFNRR
jgi:hypothetical protein